MRKIVLLLLGAVLLLGCQQGKISQQLSEVNELLVAELNDSAYQKINEIDESAISNPADKAYYTLLKVRSALLVGKHIASSDSLLDGIIAYYEQNPDKEKLTDAYYYRAIESNIQKDYEQSIMYYKEAEKLAEQSNNICQQFKVVEGIAFVNAASSNFHLQLLYAKKALKLSQEENNKKWEIYSHYWLHLAYSELGYKDSAMVQLNAIPQYLEYVGKKDLPYFLTNLALEYKEKEPEIAKEYLQKSLSYIELTRTYEHLADICYDEGKFDECYDYLKKALLVNDATPKDNIIRNLIEYDIERGKTDSISDMLTQIIEIRDSIDAKLRNDTIKDLQMRFDHETAIHAKDQAIIRWQWGIMILALALLAGIGLYIRRRYLNKIKLQGYQMQINDCLNQIDALKATGSDAQKKIEELNQQISDIMDNRAPGLNKGRVLYDDIVANRDISNWSKEDETLFLEYYTATNYRAMQQLKAIPREDKLTNHRLIFLILQEMGKSELDILRILSISKETLRTLRHRTKPKE